MIGKHYSILQRSDPEMTLTRIAELDSCNDVNKIDEILEHNKYTTLKQKLEYLVQHMSVDVFASGGASGISDEVMYSLVKDEFKRGFWKEGLGQ